MKKSLLIPFILCCLAVLPETSRATSLDELYRDIVRSENQGYLPLFVKNRAIPDILFEEEILKQNISDENHQIKSPVPDPVNLTNDRLLKEQKAKASLLQWEQTIQAVRENRVTPLELQEIINRARREDPHATEILAWMYAKGVGVRPDLAEAFSLYQKAETLKVPQASENALKVYKAMSPQQRRDLQGTHNFKI